MIAAVHAHPEFFQPKKLLSLVWIYTKPVRYIWSMRPISNIAKGCYVWVLMTQSAMALPGPEILIPMGVGLVQIAALLLATLNIRRFWRRLKGPAKLIFMVVTTWVAVSVFDTINSSGVSLGMIVKYSTGPTPTELPFLPRDLSKAIPADPVPGSMDPGLRRGGKVVVYLGDPGDYLNEQVQTNGYALRLPDWESRREELAAASSEIIYLRASFVDVPDGLNAISIREISDLLSYEPPAPVFWNLVIPKKWMSQDAPSSPKLFQYGIPKIRLVDADSPIQVLRAERLTLDEVASIKPAPRIIADSHYRAAANTLHVLKQSDLSPEAFLLHTKNLSPIQRTKVNPFTLILLVLVAAISSRFIGQQLDRARTKRIAARMRKDKGPSHVLDALWSLAPLPSAFFFCGATQHLGLSPSLWAWNSPPAYSLNAWVSPLLLLASTTLWMVRAGRLPQLQRTLCQLIGLCVLFYLVRSGDIYLGHLAFPLLMFLACMVGSLCVSRRGRGWAFLRSHREGMGAKAENLQDQFAQSRHIAEGLVIWPDEVDDPVQIIQSKIGAGRTILRSTANNENDSFGTYKSVVVAGDEIKDGLREVLDSYGDKSGRAVLCMPYIPSSYSGVARVDLSGVHVEIGTGTDGVTAGHATIGRAHWHRHSRRTVGHPHFGLLGELKRWDRDEAVLVEWVGSWVVQCTQAPAEAGWFGEAWQHFIAHRIDPCVLQRVGAESLASPSGERTLEHWRSRWGKNDAFGRAIQQLQLWRFLLPKDVVLKIGGALYVHGGRWQVVEAMLWARSQLPDWQAEQILGRIWEASDPEDLDQLIQNSIALRMLQPYLPSDSSTLPVAPSTLFQEQPQDFPHRSTFDLDWGTPRYGQGLGPVQKLAPVPVLLGREACAYLRDWTHDCICRHIAQMQQEDPSWLEQDMVDGSPPFGTITPTDLENRMGAWNEPAFWVGTPGDVVGVVSDIPGPNHILFLENPRPDLIQDGFLAIVGKHGGRYSHAALVCNQRGLRALFSTGVSLSQGDRVQLTTAGKVVTHSDAGEE